MKTLLIIPCLFYGVLGFSQSEETERLLTSRDSEKKVEELNKRSESLWSKGEYAEGMVCAKAALESAKELGLKEQQGDALNNIGIIHDYQGRYADALSNYFRAVKIQKETRDNQGLSYTYNNIGLIYTNQKNFKKAYYYYNLALKLREEQNDLTGISTTYNNIGILEMYEGKYRKALQSYFSSARIDSTLNDPSGLSASLSNIGLVYMELAMNDSAHYFFKASLDIRNEQGDKRGIVNSHNNIATLLIKEMQYADAKAELLKGLQYGKEMGAKDLLEYTYNMLSDACEYEGDYRSALEFHKMHIAYGDSITNENNTRKQTEAEMQYVFEQERAREEFKKQQQNYLIAGLSSLLFGLFLFAFYVNKGRKKALKQNVLIAQQKRIVEEKNREILDSINYARRIQSAILPPDKVVKEYLIDSFILYKPKDIVAGDFYWIEPLGNRILVAVADCTGHGVPGAMISVICHNALNRSVREFGITEPRLILEKSRSLIIEEFFLSDENVRDGMDISLVLIDLETKQIQWSGANSPLWIKKVDSSSIEQLQPNRQPIGKHEVYEPFDQKNLELNSGDVLYLFSDGYPDQFGGPSNKKLKLKGFKALIEACNLERMDRQKEYFEQSFEQWKATNEQVDDVCMIGIRI